MESISIFSNQNGGSGTLVGSATPTVLNKLAPTAQSLIDIRAMLQIWRSGNTGDSITTGAKLMVSGATTTTYAQRYNSLSSAISDPIAENIFDYAGYAIKGIDSAVPYLHIAHELAHEDVAGIDGDSTNTINSIAACDNKHWARRLNGYTNRAANDHIRSREA